MAKTNEEYLISWLKQKLRRLSFQWPPRKAALRKARVSRGKYECSKCKELGVERLYGPKEIVLDHQIPVVDTEMGFVDWNTYIERLFCDESGWNVMCKECHDIKTFLENEIRKESRKEKQPKKQIEDDL